MSNSPTVEIFAVFDPVTGDPKSGIAGSLSFSSYTDDQGTVLSQPTITEIGSTGIYKFTVTFPTDTARSVVYMLSTDSNLPKFYWRNPRREDAFADKIDLIRKLLTNKEKIFTSGADANRLVHYEDDGTTVLLKFDLKDSSGLPTTVNPFQKVPV